jgi:hypothetical protein
MCVYGILLGYLGEPDHSRVPHLPRSIGLLCQQSMVVVVTDHAGHLPCTILVLPQRHKLGVPHTILRVSRVVEAMYPDLYRSVSLQRVHLERVR